MKKLLLMTIALAVTSCAKPTPKASEAPANLIREAIGVAGVELGMTPTEVEAKRGKPVRQNAQDGHVVFMSFHKEENFGVYFDPVTSRVRMIIASVKDKTWCTDFDVCLYREGDLAKLKAHHGDKLLRFVDRDGSVTYRLLGNKGANTVMTEYTPSEAHNGVVQVTIMDWTGPITQSSFD